MPLESLGFLRPGSRPRAVRRADTVAATPGVLAALAVGLLGACGERDVTARASTRQPTVSATPSATSASRASRASRASPAAVAAPADEASDAAPRMTNPEPPFRYPPALYARQVQGNVMLRLWVDSAGLVRPESTRVVEPSGYSALDSAAVRGSEALRFAPAVRDGRATGATILFPVYFRHPAAAPLPGDSVLRNRQALPR